MGDQFVYHTSKTGIETQFTWDPDGVLRYATDDDQDPETARVIAHYESLAFEDRALMRQFEAERIRRERREAQRTTRPRVVGGSRRRRNARRWRST